MQMIIHVQCIKRLFKQVHFKYYFLKIGKNRLHRSRW